VTNSNQPASIAELLQCTRDAYADYEAAITEFGEERFMEPNAFGDWSVRDVIAHVGASQMWIAGQLEALIADVEPTMESCYRENAALPSEGTDITTQDGRNAWQRERLATLSLDEVRELADTGHRRLVVVIESFSDDDLTMPLTIAELGLIGQVRRPKEGETFAPALWEWLRGETYHHYADHARDIRQASNTNPPD
jgi:hypothetical protein